MMDPQGQTATKGDNMDDFDDLIAECGADLPADREPALNADEQSAKDIADLYAVADELDAFFARD